LQEKLGLAIGSLFATDSKLLLLNLKNMVNEHVSDAVAVSTGVHGEPPYMTGHSDVYNMAARHRADCRKTIAALH
jgi:hypothetical protein